MFRRSIVGIAPCLLAALPVVADDAAITSGGSPQILSAHKTIAMQSEVVRIHIGEAKMTVDCDFVFRNDGPACTVRMGFPDEGSGDTTFNLQNKRSAFLSFQSYVNGQKTSTELVAAKEMLWHAKSVHFPANGTVRVRDVYNTMVGSMMQPFKDKPAETGVPILHTARYTLRTGASWKGNIGSAEIIVTFDRARPSRPIDAEPIRHGDPRNDNREYDTLTNTTWHERPNLVYWHGFAEPTVQGNQLRFVRKDWEPTDRSDLVLYFGMDTPPLHPPTASAPQKTTSP